MFRRKPRAQLYWHKCELREVNYKVRYKAFNLWCKRNRFKFQLLEGVRIESIQLIYKLERLGDSHPHPFKTCPKAPMIMYGKWDKLLKKLEKIFPLWQRRCDGKRRVCKWWQHFWQFLISSCSLGWFNAVVRFSAKSHHLVRILIIIRIYRKNESTLHW